MEMVYHDNAYDPFINTFPHKDGLLDLSRVIWSRSVGSLASDGAFLKSVVHVNDDVYYLKLSNYDSYRGVFGHESVNECIACRLGGILGFSVASGILREAVVVIDGIAYQAHVFISKSFKAIDSRASFEAFYLSHRESPRESPLDFSIRNGWKTDILSMFVFDYLIINRDRHGGNIEVLKNGGIRLSPLFDNGLSFVCTCRDDADIGAFDSILDRKVNNFIGEQSLEKNLRFIDTKLCFHALKSEHRKLLFQDIGGILSQSHMDKIWEIVTVRWKNVEKFRVAR